MHIENHRLKVSIRALTESDIHELMDLLGIPVHLWEVKKNYRTEALYGYQYAFGTSKQSVCINIGKQDQHHMNPVGRDISTDKHIIPAGYQPFYREGYLLLHGSFFDNAPDFSLESLLRFLKKVGYTAKELDIAFCDEQGVTRIEDWIRVFENYRSHVIGNMIRKQKILVVRDSGRFERVQIGVAKSKTMYGTLYMRPDGTIRLEIKMRNGKQIGELLNSYQENDRSAYRQVALSILTASLDILTDESKKTKKVELYVREPFWAEFLASQPKKISWKDKKKIIDRNEKDIRDSYTKSIQEISGRFKKMLQRFAGHKTEDGIVSELLSAIGKPIGTPLLS